uniref:Uncharacterized protein n=1 Tax=Mandrillus leucophaeus TaxID=9568 RepID=A0A2K5Y140_MANLE
MLLLFVTYRKLRMRRVRSFPGHRTSLLLQPPISEPPHSNLPGWVPRIPPGACYTQMPNQYRRGKGHLSGDPTTSSVLPCRDVHFPLLSTHVRVAALASGHPQASQTSSHGEGRVTHLAGQPGFPWARSSTLTQSQGHPRSEDAGASVPAAGW